MDKKFVMDGSNAGYKECRVAQLGEADQKNVVRHFSRRTTKQDVLAGIALLTKMRLFIRDD